MAFVLVEPVEGGGGRVRGHLHGIILGISDVRLIAGLPAAPQFAVRKRQLECAEMPEHLGQLRRRHSRR
jgi:hypothetical protein